MTLYIIRHGESEGNLANVHQSVDELLTPHGIAQAEKMAARFRSQSIDLIIASHAKRAIQTAQEIVKVTKAPMIIDENLLEKVGPSELVGVQHGTDKSQKIHDLAAQNIDDPDYHYADEENNWDFIKRIDKAVKALEKRSEENVIVVTHGFSIKALIGIMLFGPEFSSRQFEQLKWKMETRNTGITICEYSQERGWRLVTFNDHAHLLE